jgi:hypothetical protein
MTTMKGAAVGRRYSISIKLTRYRGHRGVWLTLYHPGALPEAVYAAAIRRDMGAGDADARALVRATFDQEEKDALRGWAATRQGLMFSAVPALAPRRGEAFRPGGEHAHSGSLLLNALDGFPLAVAIFGYYDLHNADAGPLAEDC